MQMVCIDKNRKTDKVVEGILMQLVKRNIKRRLQVVAIFFSSIYYALRLIILRTRLRMSTKTMAPSSAGKM